MKKVGIAILGLGSVGGGVYKILRDHREFYRTSQRLDLSVESVLEPDGEKLRALGVPNELAASNIAEVACNPDVNVVVECIGGTEAAREYVMAALFAGKTVVTSNKELYCKYSLELERTAKEHNAGLYFEACCLGGVPVVRVLQDGLQSNVVSSLSAIVDGEANEILTRAAEEGVSCETVLSQARPGLSGPDAEIEALDAAAYKLSILASLAFHAKVPFAKIFREGISGISPVDVAECKRLGYALKPLAVGKNTENGIEVRIHPALVETTHPLASVSGGRNAVCLAGDSVGEITLVGKGSGELPAGSAVVSDVIYAATRGEHRYSAYRNASGADKSVKFVSDFKCPFYLRLTVADRPGILSKVASVFGKNNVSLRTVLQTEGEPRKASIVVLTHETHESCVKEAVEKFGATDYAKVETVLRVEE